MGHCSFNFDFPLKSQSDALSRAGRSNVVPINQGYEACQAKVREGMLHNCSCNFGCQTLSPEIFGNQISNLDLNPVVDCPGNESAPANKTICLTVDSCPKPKLGVFWPTPIQVPVQLLFCFSPAQYTFRKEAADITVRIQATEFVEIILPEFSEDRSGSLDYDQDFTHLVASGPVYNRSGDLGNGAFRRHLNCPRLPCWEVLKHAPHPRCTIAKGQMDFSDARRYRGTLRSRGRTTIFEDSAL